MTRINEIVFATCNRLPDLTEDDRLVVKYLGQHGITVRPLIWDSDDQWEHNSPTIVIRSCWDYHYKPEQFQQWIDRVEDRGAGLWNPARVVRWNADKIYLRELQEKGVTIPETIWLESQTQADLQ